jgi:hypothetical protein
MQNFNLKSIQEEIDLEEMIVMTCNVIELHCNDIRNIIENDILYSLDDISDAIRDNIYKNDKKSYKDNMIHLQEISTECFKQLKEENIKDETVIKLINELKEFVVILNVIDKIFNITML